MKRCEECILFLFRVRAHPIYSTLIVFFYIKIVSTLQFCWWTFFCVYFHIILNPAYPLVVFKRVTLSQWEDRLAADLTLDQTKAQIPLLFSFRSVKLTSGGYWRSNALLATAGGRKRNRSLSYTFSMQYTHILIRSSTTPTSHFFLPINHLWPAMLSGELEKTAFSNGKCRQLEQSSESHTTLIRKNTVLEKPS